MTTDNFIAWQDLLIVRDRGLLLLFALSMFLIGSYLVTYVTWIPPKWGKYTRLVYEVGGILLYILLVYVSVK